MKSWIFIGLLLTVLCSGAYVYYVTTQNALRALMADNATLAANNQVLDNANQRNVEVIQQLELMQEQIRQEFARAQAEFQQVRAQNDLLRQRLGRHELDALAAARPGLVERTINNASANVARCFELLSGAPLSDRERGAANARAFNSECPWLWEELR
jgi:hypothetical protein